MKAGLDTSVVLRLLLGQPADQAARAVAFLDERSRGGHHAAVSDLVVAETGFVDRLIQPTPTRPTKWSLSKKRPAS